MKIKKRGWIGKDRPIGLIEKELVRSNQLGLDLVIDTKKEMGKPEDWKDGQWPPRLVDFMIEVEEVPLCRVCGEPSEGDEVISPHAVAFLHSQCAKDEAERIREFCLEMNQVGDVIKANPWGYRGKDRKKKTGKVCMECGKPQKKRGTIHCNLNGDFVHHECLFERKIEKIEDTDSWKFGNNAMIAIMISKINQIIDRMNKGKSPPVGTRPAFGGRNED